MRRRDFLRTSGTLGLWAGVHALLPRYVRGAPAAAAGEPVRRGEDGIARIDLTIAETPLEVGRRRGTATTINGTVPAPLLRLREGETTVIRVANRLGVDTSIHWHGVLVPPAMDGVPGVSFPGIRAGTTFDYRFQLRQYGTYWYHSHSAFQEQLGHYGPLIIEPALGKHPFPFDREHVVVLSDWTFDGPARVLSRLKKQGNYYNLQRRTVFDFFSDVGKEGLASTVDERLMWARMRMDPTDLLDVNGSTYTYLMNGRAPESSWTGLFRPGERVLLHFINASANSLFDVRIPGLPMTVVEASGQHVQPVDTDEFRIATAETYVVLVEPRENQAYCVFAEAIDRSGHARGTLAPRQGMTAAIPAPRKRPVLTMADMGMEHGGEDDDMKGMTHMSDMSHESPSTSPRSPAVETGSGGGDLATYAVAGAIRTEGLRPPGTLPGMLEHEPSNHGPGNSMVPMMVKSRLGEPGVGLGEDGWRVLAYTDLRALEKRDDFAAPAREIELHLTGNMDRFMWSIDGVPFEDSEPIRLLHGERLRLTMVNDTMMNHPMHLHGMWMELENGHRELIPRVHTVNVKPAERLSLLITADAPGRWAFHCHLLYHMEAGMFRVVEVSQPSSGSGAHHGG